MVIFNSYVKLPEGNFIMSQSPWSNGTPLSKGWDFPAKPEVVGLPAHRRHVPQDALDAQDLGRRSKRDASDRKESAMRSLASWVCDATLKQQLIPTVGWSAKKETQRSPDMLLTWHIWHADPCTMGTRRPPMLKIQSHGAPAAMLNILQHIYRINTESHRTYTGQWNTNTHHISYWLQVSSVIKIMNKPMNNKQSITNKHIHVESFWNTVFALMMFMCSVTTIIIIITIIITIIKKNHHHHHNHHLRHPNRSCREDGLVETAETAFLISTLGYWGRWERQKQGTVHAEVLRVFL